MDGAPQDTRTGLGIGGTGTLSSVAERVALLQSVVDRLGDQDHFDPTDTTIICLGVRELSRELALLQARQELRDG